MSTDRQPAGNKTQPSKAKCGPERVGMRVEDWTHWGVGHRGWTGSTPALYVRRAQAADRWLRTHRGVGLAEGDLSHWRAWWESVPLTAPSRNMARKTLAAFGGWQVHTGTRTTNPADGLPVLKPKQGVPRALTSAEAREVTRAAQETPLRQLGVAVLLMLWCGLRNAETRTLRWNDARHDWVYVTGKGGHTRTVPLPALVRGELARWKAVAPRSAYVVTSNHPDRLTMPASDTWLRRHTVALTGHVPHTMRHTYATGLLEAGADLRMVQDALGHVSPATTAIYTRVRPSKLAATADLLFTDPDQQAA